MTSFERVYLGLLPFLPPLYRQVRRGLKSLIPVSNANFRLLDVGGRKSHYTIGLPAKITVSDLPRESDVQKMLHLGTNDQMMKQVQSRRTNIEAMIYDDMTQSRLESGSFDGIVSVEVLEHVEEDGKFIDHVYRVLKPGGFFLMTTPNGDFVKNTNPDHKRHYKRDQLAQLLAERFGANNVQVDYAIATGKSRRLGLKPWSPKKPITTIASMGGNVVNGWLSARAQLASRPVDTHHLIARALKK